MSIKHICKVCGVMTAPPIIPPCGHDNWATESINERVETTVTLSLAEYHKLIASANKVDWVLVENDSDESHKDKGESDGQKS